MKTKLRLGSLFDGAGGFPYGGSMVGIAPIWASEIEPFPIKVTRKNYPDMIHYGDVSKVNGAEVPPVDIITFGSPCQDLSLAGKRTGLDGERSGLFHQAVRIITEMREATNGKYPRYAVWENVAGAFSSNGGEDFRIVLEELCKIKEQSVSIPRPPKGKWHRAGAIVGDDYSIAWRQLDAQFWGVPQRRKRIYLVADFGGSGAGKILFESEGLSRYTPKMFRERENITTGVGESAEETRCYGIDGYNHTIDETVSATLGVNCGMSTGRSGVLELNRYDFSAASNALNSLGFDGSRIDPSLDIESPSTDIFEELQKQYLFENHSADSRYTGPLDVSPTVTSLYGTGGNNQPLVVSKDTPKTQVAYTLLAYESHAMRSDNPNSGIYETDHSVCIDCSGVNPSRNQGGLLVVGRGCENKPASYGLGRALSNAGYDSQISLPISKESMPTLCSTGPGSVGTPIYSLSKTGHMTMPQEDIVSTLAASDYKEPPCVTVDYIVRRLTPLECARLQGFPDDYVDGIEVTSPTEADMSFWREVFDEYGELFGKKPKTDNQIRKWLAQTDNDSALYKMWGNSVAIPNVAFVLAGIEWFDRNYNDM